MRKPTNLRLILLTLFLLQSYLMLAQKTFVDFKPRFETSIRGDMMLIGNNIVNRDNNKKNEYANDAFTGGSDNNSENMQYIDIDSDPDTFSSSSATLKVPDASRACYNIVYAGLYWSGIYTQASLNNGTVKRSELGNIKFKLPKETAYHNLSGTLIYDYYNGNPKSTNGDQVPYAYYYNVTDLLKASKNPEGEYTAANISSARGRLSNGGYAAGWSLFVIYEDPNSTAKYITAYDGFSWIQAGGQDLTYAISNFKTIPTGNVKVKLAFAALEGDKNTTGDTYSVNGTQVYTTERKTNNFFCSVINDLSGINIDRNPASSNTLGFDAGIINLNNANNAIIKNGDTKANLKLTTSGDGYGVYFNAFNVEVIAPQIALTKIVKDTDGNDIGGKNVTLGQQLRYEISIQNKGNDDATSLVITDQLPINVIFDQKNDLLPLPAGIVVKTPYDPVTRKIVFQVTDPKLITKNSPTISTIAFKVQVVPDCHALSEACSNSIDNQAFATYKGKENTSFSIDETDPQGSVNSTEGCAVTPKATNFLVGVDGCEYTENVTLCTDSVDLIPAKGYDKYTWYSDAKMTIKIGEGSPFNVTKEGTYYVYNLAQAPCRSISQSFVVTRFKSTTTNPVLPFASEVLTCADTGQPFPNIYLCGGNDKKVIKTNITDASNIVWERFVEGSCTVSTGQNCPNESLTSTGNPSELCKWEQVGIGSDYTANAKGRYRLTVTYKGGVCFNRFYFDVYQNPLTPTEKHTDIICSSNGSITVEGVPAGYEYAISKDPNGAIGAYQSSNIFPISTPGSYTVHVKQTNVTTFPCDFTVENILIRKLDVDIKKVITQPLCAGAKGSVEVAANNVNPNYTFVIKQGNTTVQSVGPISQNSTKFDLLPGDYTLTVTTADGCSNISDVKIVAPDALTATYELKSLTACSDGEITVNAKGGTAPYYYSINGQPFVSENKITVVNPGGSYSIKVVDSNDCEYTIPTFSVNPIAKPTVTINTKDLNCYNSKEGEISISVTPADSGYTVSYSVAGVNGGAYTSLPTTGLTEGDYTVTVKYTINGIDCTDPEKIVKITGPSATLSASGGVAELSGCGPTGHEDQGLVRITNAQGGVPFPAPNPYRYSFDNGATWGTSNQAYLDPSVTPYTLLIKDAAGCIFEVSGIVLEAKPAKPTFDVSDAVYNCNGDGTVTVTAHTSPSTNYTYSYYIGKPDPANPGSYIYTLNTNTPANIFKDVPAGDYKIKVEYTLVTAASYSNLLIEDFGNGKPTTTTGIADATTNPPYLGYCFNDQRVNPPYVCGTRSVEDNQYSVTSFFWRSDGYTSWFPFKDHTTNPNNLPNVGREDGRYLLVNIGREAGPYGRLYMKPIVDVIPNQPVIVDLYVGNLLTAGKSGFAPELRFELVNGAGQVVATQNTGKIADAPNDPNRNKWVKISLSLNPGNYTNLNFVIRSGSQEYNGNDLVIDDIWVRQLPKSCLSAETLDLKVENEKAFKAEVKGINGVSCNNGTDGGFSIYVENFDTTNGFYYTLNGGASSPTWINSKVSPVVITGRAAGTHDVRVRYANNASTCNFTIPTLVPSKDPFIVNATASAATCKGATVTATATGGTPAYTITLKDKNSTYTRTFPSDGILNEVPAGTYIISGVDSKSCSDSMDTELVIDPATKPRAEVVQNSGLCFDNNNGAKITVNIIGGLGPFTYKVSTDGGTNYGPLSLPFNTTSFDYIATTPGTYSFLITDANSCDALAISQKIDEQISARSSISGALTCTTGKATIQVTIEGGTTPFKYVVKNKATNAVLFNSGNIAGPTFTYTDVPGTYVFTITDKNGCTAIEEKEIKPTEPVTAEHKVENVTCYNAANGYVDITPLTGVGPFTYQFNGTGAFKTDTHYGPLAGSVAGITYSYIVKDNLGCEQTYTFKVYQPEDLVPSASITVPYTCETNATISASAVGGNPGGYTFVLKNTTTNTTVGSNTTGLFENLTTPGSYSVTVTDSKNCTKTITVPGQINALNPPKGMTISNSAVTCPSNKATVNITNVVNAANVAVPTAGLEYRIKAPAAYATTTFQSSNSFVDLNAGVTYTFEVRDANKCLYEKTHEIKALPVISVEVASQNNVACSGESNGTATFTVSGLGNNTNYSYVVDSRAAVTGTSPSTGTTFEITITGLNEGDHLFTITNTATSCPASITVKIIAPATPLSKNPETLTHVTCDVKGTATINVVGGWGTYTYVVTPPTGPAITQTTGLFTNLEPGNYTYIVTDLNKCSVNGSFTIDDKVDPIASIDTTTDLCAGGTGATIRVTPNAAPNFVYSLNGGTPQNNGTFTGLIPDTYTVRVTDTSTGCYTDLASQIVASPVEASIGLDKDLDCDPINPNAIIRVKIKNGYPDYKYRVSTNGSAYTGAYISVGAGQTEFTHTTTTGDNAATYEFEILDSNNCRTTVTQNIAAKVLPDFSFEVEDVKCKGDLTGTITVTGNPANGTYEYSINNGPFQPTNVFTGLGQGVYQVTIRDDKKCVRTKPVTINEPANALSASAVATDLKCGTNNVAQTSTITVTAQNGTPFAGTNKYKYYYNGSTTFVYSNTYTTSTSGVVDIIVEDANGCTTTTSATVNTLNPPSALAFSAPAITCDPAKSTTDLLVTVTDGVLPFKYEITSTTAAVAPATPVVTNVNSNTYTFTGLAPGNYNFRITDKNDCTVTGSYEIKDVVKITASNRIIKNVSCNNGNDGEIEFTISGNVTGGYTQTLTGSVTGVISGGTKVGDVITYTGLTPQDYTFVVTNTGTTCNATQTVTLVNPTLITIDSAVASKVFCDKADTTIKVVASGGTGTLYYAVVGATEAAPTFPADYNTTGIFTKNTTTLGLNYNVYVQDNKGCPVQTTVSVVKDNPPTIDPAPTTCFTGTASVTITGSVYGGTALYGIDGVYSTDPTKIITGPGSYVLSIKDDNNCEVKTTLVVNDQLKLTVTPNKDVTCSVIPPFTTVDAQVTLSAAGGNGTYVYGYSTSSTGPFATLPGDVFNTSTIGTYYFNVTSDGCSAISSATFEVTTPQKPTATAISTNPKCYNVSEGTITVTGHAGVPGYQYRINGGAWQDSPMFTDLSAAVAPGTDYTYEVKDMKGCISDPETITLVQPSEIVVDRTLVGITCNSTNGVSLGSISINTVSGGTGPYDYYVTGRNYNKSFSNVPGTSQVFEIVDFGLYEIRIIDSNNCSYIEEVTITSPPEDLDITVTAPPPADCTALGSAIVAVGSNTSIPVGNGPFYFSYYTGVKPVYPTTGTWYPETTPLQTVIPNLIPGVRYTFIVYDSKSGCYYYEIADMPIPSNSTLTVGAPTAQNVTCTGSADGKVSFVVSSTYGTATPITYQVYDALSLAPLPINGSGTVPANGSLTISGFGAMPYGDYFVLVKEDTGATNAGCSKSTAMFSIRQSAVLLVADYEIVKNDNCKSEAGIIRVSGTEGTAPYKYMVTTTATTPDALDAAWTSVPVFNRDSNNYYAWVKDAYGCIQGTPVFLLPLDPSPEISLNVVNYCAKEGAFEVNVTVDTPGIGQHYISVNNGTFTEITGLTYTIKNLNSGPVNVVVRDANGCESTAASTIINPTPLASALVTKVLDCSVSGNAVANAAITVTVSNGTTPYATYEVKKGSGTYTTINPTTTVAGGKTTFVYSVPAADADTYVFRITDDHSCPVETNVVKVDAIVPITPSSNPIQPLCNGGNGTIELSAIGGKAPYKFSFNGSTFSDDAIYTAAAGPYTFIVRDNLGCEVTGNGTLNQPTPLADNGAVVDGLKCTTGNATVAATVKLVATPGSGSGSYLYSFNGSDFTTKDTYTVDTNADQTIPYVIRDTNGCEITGSVDIHKLNPPTNFTMTQGPVITCTTLSTSVTISAVQNGVGALTYQIISPASAAFDNAGNNVFTGLLPDVDYVFQVTDANGCTVQKPFKINNVININIKEQSRTPITCLGTSDGKASFFVSGFGTGAGTYHYVLDSSPAVVGLTSSTIDLIGLSAGSHTITVYDDATNCEMPITFTIAAPTTALALAPLNVTPKGCTTFGGVTMTASFGWGDYTYTVQQPDGSNLSNKTGIFGNLIQLGVYNVHVIDANGCRIDDSFRLDAPIDPTATIAASSDYCYVNGGNTTTLVVTANSLSPFDVRPFEYSINNGQTWQISDTFSNLSPGDYTILVRDKFGCKSIAFNTEIKGQLYASANAEKQIYCVGTLPSDGTIRVKAAGGYGPYRYTVTYNGVTSAINNFTNASYSDYTVSSSANGVYVFDVYDAHDCHVATNTVDMLVPTAVTFNVVPTSPYCSGLQGNITNGSLLVTLAPGNNDRDYTYTIQRTIPAGGALISQNTPLFTGLIAGTYRVTVISGKQCSDSKTIDIDEPTPVLAAATLSDFECSGTNTTKSTVVTVTATGGAGGGVDTNYTYSDNGTNWRPDNKFTVSNEVAQNLTFYAKDANGCIDEVQVPIPAFPKLTAATASLGDRASCDNNGRETIHVVIAGGASPANFDYEVYQDGQILQTATPVGLGNSSFDYIAPTAGHFYQFRIIDNKTFCSITTDAYEVPLYNTAKVVATASASVSCNGGTNGEITIDVIDYKGSYTYQVFNAGVAVPGASGAGDSSVTNPLIIANMGASSAYTVVIKEDLYPFCSVTSNTFEITQPPLLDLINFKPTVKNQNCNTAGAVITIDETQIVGGTKGYKYVVVLPTAGIPADASFKDEKIITIPTTAIAPAFDTWHVYVMDAKGCKEFVPVNISRDPMPAITNVTVDSPCYNVNGYKINVFATGVVKLEYSLDGQQYQDDPFFIVKDAGDYIVSVRDANKCVVTATTAFNIPEPLTLKADITTVPTCMTATGEVTLTAGGGKSPASYVYAKDDWSAPSLSNVFTGLTPGSYRFFVRDVATNCEKYVDVTIDTPTLVTGIDAKGFDVTCNTYRDGRIEVKLAASNNNPVYRYSLAGPENRPLQDSPYFYDLPAGNYVVSVVSGKGCPGTAPVTVGQPDPIVVDQPLVKPYACNVGNTAIDATITVPAGSVRGGSNDYIRYQFVRNGTVVQDDDRNVYTESDYLGGRYDVYVFDSKGCQGGYSSVTIDMYVDIARLDLTTTKINCRDDESVKVTAIPTRGTLPTLTYTIQGTNNTVYPVTNSPTGLFAGLKPGTYLIKVTNSVTGCGVEKPYIVNEPNTFRFVASDIKNVTCFTDTNGSITLTLVDDIPTPTDESGPFTYVLTHESGTSVSGNSNGTRLDLSGLASGKYTITATLTGVPYCPVTTNFTIQGPTAALEIKYSKKEITCVTGNDDGEIRVSAQGGWLGNDYLYRLDGPVTVDFSTQSVFSGLKAGLYTVSVRDAGGCIDTDQVTLVVPTPIVVVASSDKTLLLCNGDMSATITATSVTGGQGSNYLYTLNTTSVTPVRSSGPQTTPSFAGLGAGTYVVTVTDGFNCIGESAPITINEPTKVKPSLVETRKMTCLTQTQLTLSATGGTPPYTYSTDNVTYSMTTFTSSVPFEVAPGAYKYYVKDANGCVGFVSNEITIPELEPLKANLDVTHAVVLCREDESGVIVANATGGLGNYQYILLDGAGNILKGPQSEGRFDKLSAGDYKVVVKSGDCETLPEDVNIDQPKEVFSAEFIPTAVKCFGGNDGRIEVIGKGGTGSYTYSISPRNDQYFDSNIFEKLKAGFYTVIAQDENGCYDTEIVEIKQPEAPLSVAETPGMTMPEECAGELNGAFTIDIAGGTPPYLVSLNDINGTYQPVTGTQHTFENLAGGIYTVFVKDGGNCPQEVEVSVPLPVTLNPVAEVTYDCVNNAQANMVVVTIDASITDPTEVDYSLDNNGTFQPSNIFTNVAPGSHFIVARHTNGCEVPTPIFEVAAVDPVSVIDVTNQSKDINTIVVKASGGVAPYEYSFNGEPFTSSNNYRIYKTGDYVVIVRDKNGCEATITVHGTFYDFCLPNYFTPNGDGQNDTIGPDCGALAYKELTFDIYDRYGRVVAKYHVGQKWDGTYHGNELPTGDYWYVLKLNDPKDPREFVGHFTLYR